MEDLKPLTNLKKDMRRFGIEQQAIAAEAGVLPTHVCNVLAGRRRSARIVKLARSKVRAAKQLKAEQSQLQTPQEATR